jgi:carotenoid cleavage dioxygenase
MRSDDPMSLFAGWSVMAGEYRHQPGARLTTASLDLRSGTAKQSVIGENEGEFPVIAPADVGRPDAPLVCLERTPTRPASLPDSTLWRGADPMVARVDSSTVTTGWWKSTCLLRIAVIPAPRWIVGTALDTRNEQTVLSVFDVRGLADGPVVQARLPYSIPLGLHGTYTPD